MEERIYATMSHMVPNSHIYIATHSLQLIQGKGRAERSITGNFIFQIVARTISLLQVARSHLEVSELKSSEILKHEEAS